MNAWSLYPYDALREDDSIVIVLDKISEALSTAMSLMAFIGSCFW